MVRPGENHHLEGVRESLLVDLPVASEAKVGLEEGLRVECGAELDQRRDLPIARVPPNVGRTRRDDHGLTGLDQPFLGADPELRRPAADLEPLLLEGMDMRCRHESRWAEVQVHLHQLAAGVTGALPKDDSLAGNGMDQRVVFCADPGGLTSRDRVGSDDGQKLPSQLANALRPTLSA